MTSDIPTQNLDLLWSWWAELGVPGVERTRSDLVVDLEWLLAFSPGLAAHDARLLNLVHAWAYDHHGWVRARRLERVLDQASEPIVAAFTKWSARLGDEVAWARTDETTEPSQPVRRLELDLGRPCLAPLRARAVFGTDARPEVLCAMLTTQDTWHHAGSLEDVGTSRRNVARVLSELAEGQLLDHRRAGRRREYRLSDPDALEALLGAAGLRWTSWAAIMGAMAALQRLSAARTSPTILWRVKSTAEAATLRDAADRLRWSPPPDDLGDLPALLRWGAESLRQLARPGPSRSLDETWFDDRRAAAEGPLASRPRRPATMEVRSSVSTQLNASPEQLLEAARHAQVPTFGWPLGVVLQDAVASTLADAQGIEAVLDRPSDDETFDLWACRANGDRYIFTTLFEDRRNPDVIAVNTRIQRVTEALLHLARFYRWLGAPDNATIRLRIRHGGLQGRFLTRSMSHPQDHLGRSSTDASACELTCSLTDLEESTASLCRQVLAPLFALFDHTSFELGAYEDVVDRFVNGIVT